MFRAIRAGVFKLRLKWAFSGLETMDYYLRRQPRWKRKQFWRDFVDRENFRNVTFDNIPGLEWLRRKRRKAR